MRITSVEPGRRIALPEEWVSELGLGAVAILERRPDGILVRPRPPVSWDEIFATKLCPGRVQAEETPGELSGDDLFL